MTSNALSNRQIAKAALVVLFGFLTSGVLGLVRSSIIASTFGTGQALDAFMSAQRIPEALYVLVAGGALGSSFIPIFNRFLARDDDDGAWQLASAVLTLAVAFAGVLALLVALFAPSIVPPLLAPSKPPEVQALMVSLTQIMMVTVAIFAASGLLMGILNARQVFLLPALAMSMNSLGMIFGALVLAPMLPPIEGAGQVGNANIYGLAYGAVLGALLHLVIQIPGLFKIRARLRPLLNPRLPGVRDVLFLMLPRILGLGVVQVNFIVNTALASQMVEGSISALSYAFTLMMFVLGIIGQSIGTAVFPSLAALASTQDMDGYKERLLGAVRGVLFLSLPATVLMIVLGEPLITVLYQRGEWTQESTQATAWALAFYATGIVGFSLLEILSRAFYALSNTRTPVIVGVGAMLANIALSLVFIRVIGDPDNLSRGAFAGLAFANAFTTLIEALVLWVLLRYQIGDMQIRRVLDAAARVAAASAAMGVAVWLVMGALNTQPALIVLAASGIIGAPVFFGVSLLLGVDEARSVPAMVLRRFRR